MEAIKLFFIYIKYPRELFLIIPRVSFIKDLISGALGVIGFRKSRVVRLQGPEQLMAVGCQEDFSWLLFGFGGPRTEPSRQQPQAGAFPLFNGVMRPESKPGAPNWPQAGFIFRMRRFEISFL